MWRTLRNFSIDNPDHNDTAVLHLELELSQDFLTYEIFEAIMGMTLENIPIFDGGAIHQLNPTYINEKPVYQ